MIVGGGAGQIIQSDVLPLVVLSTIGDICDGEDVVVWFVFVVPIVLWSIICIIGSLKRKYVARQAHREAEMAPRCCPHQPILALRTSKQSLIQR